VSLPPEDCCGSHRLTEEQARLYELPQPSELLEGLALEAVVLTVHDCCAMLHTAISHISISVIVSPTSVKPGENVNIRGIVTRDGQRLSFVRVDINADGYSSTVYTNTSGEYQAVFTIRRDERPRRVTVNVSSDGATATSSFEITEPDLELINADIL
jgi:hypothetical protein